MVLSQIELIAVLHPSHRTSVVPLREIDLCSYQTAHEHSVLCLCTKPSHPTTLIGLKVRDNDVCETTWVKDFGHGLAHVFIQRIGPGMDKRRVLVVNEKLIEAHVWIWGIGGDPIDPLSNLIDLGHWNVSFCKHILHWCHRFSRSWSLRSSMPARSASPLHCEICSVQFHTSTSVRYRQRHLIASSHLSRLPLARQLAHQDR